MAEENRSDRFDNQFGDRCKIDEEPTPEQAREKAAKRKQPWKTYKKLVHSRKNWTQVPAKISDDRSVRIVDDVDDTGGLGG